MIFLITAHYTKQLAYRAEPVFLRDGQAAVSVRDLRLVSRHLSQSHSGFICFIAVLCWKYSIMAGYIPIFSQIFGLLYGLV
jgi:hypothetical protein